METICIVEVVLWSLEKGKYKLRKVRGAISTVIVTEESNCPSFCLYTFEMWSTTDILFANK